MLLIRPGDGLAHVVLLGLADAVHFEVGRAGRIKSDHHAAGQDGRAERMERRWPVRAWARREEREGRQRRARSGILCAGGITASASKAKSDQIGIFFITVIRIVS